MYIEALRNEPLPAGLPDAGGPPAHSGSNGHAAAVTRVPSVLSPSLQPFSPGHAAYEMKFLLDAEQALQVERLLEGRLAIDPHARPDLGNAYQITTLYCDTPAWEVFHRVGSHRRRKYRLRRYGAEPSVHLERKIKRGERVRKRRSVVSENELSRLSQLESPADWPGAWFHRRLLRQRLWPVCCLTYRRIAYVGESAEGPLRVTFDRGLRGAVVNDWNCAIPHDALPLFADRVICEFKFRGALPGLCKSVIRQLQLSPCGVSKFRQCLRAAGVVPERSVPDA
jgi:hypothetical protein